MRVSGRNLNKKDDNNYGQPDNFNGQPDNFYPHNPLTGAPVYQQPIVVKNNYTGIIIAAVIFSIVSMIVVVAVIAAVAVPNLLESRQAANAAQAISNLRTIHTAQMTFYAASDGSKFATLEELKNAGLIEEKSSRNSQFTYTLTLSPYADRYCVTAHAAQKSSAAPNSNQIEKAYGVGRDGVIYVSENGSLLCYNGELSGYSLRPLQ